MVWKSLVILVGSFFVGSLSLSILASKTFFGGDIREKGSGNAGATNMARVHGWGAGLLTLAGDAAKAAVCMLAGKALAGEIGLCLGAGACMLGHCFPVLHNFKGGKGIAVGGAVGFGIDWRVGLCTVGAFLAGAPHASSSPSSARVSPSPATTPTSSAWPRAPSRTSRLPAGRSKHK